MCDIKTNYHRDTAATAVCLCTFTERGWQTAATAVWTGRLTHQGYHRDTAATAVCLGAFTERVGRLLPPRSVLERQGWVENLVSFTVFVFSFVPSISESLKHVQRFSPLKIIA